MKIMNFHQISSDFGFFQFWENKMKCKEIFIFFLFSRMWILFSKVASWIWLMYWYFGSRLNLEQATTTTTTNNTPTTTATQISTATKQINIRIFSSETSFLPIHGPLKKGNGSQEIGNDTTEDFEKRFNQKAFGKRCKDKALEKWQATKNNPQKTFEKRWLRPGILQRQSCQERSSEEATFEKRKTL